MKMEKEPFVCEFHGILAHKSVLTGLWVCPACLGEKHGRNADRGLFQGTKKPKGDDLE